LPSAIRLRALFLLPWQSDAFSPDLGRTGLFAVYAGKPYLRIDPYLGGGLMMES
jgi:hypothetical protein